MKLDAATIYGFSNSLLLSRYDNPQPTPSFHIELWTLLCDDHHKVAIAAPRGFAKTTAMTHAYTLANVCFGIKDHILIVSDTEAQAVDFLRDIKAEFLENDLLISAFGFKRLLKDKEAEIVGEFSDGRQFRIIAKGSEQKVRGIKWRNKRPNLVIGDDLENDDIVLNEERRAKFKSWFYSALLPCGGDDCHYRIAGTILHLDSLLESLMPELGKDTTIEDGLLQYGMVTGSWKSYRYKAHNEDYSLLLWPEKFPEQRLRSIREDYVRQGLPEKYAKEYLNYPIDESTAFFRKEDLLPTPDNLDVPLIHYISVDLAISSRDRRAFTVFVVAGVDSGGRLYVKRVVRGRMDSLEIIETFFSLQIAYEPEMFFVEQENIARALGPLLDREMVSRSTYLSITPMTATQDKPMRARPLQAILRAGGMFFDKSKSWYTDLEHELLTFPSGKYMDQVDALAWIPLGLQKIRNAPTRRELDDELYETEYAETSFGYDTGGRSAYTGY